MIKALIVEDDLGFAIEIEMLLREIGEFEITIVTRSEKAVQIMEVEIPDLLLIDVRIKGALNGIEIYKKYQKAKIPVVFFTSYKDESLYKQVRSISSAPYLVKPFDRLTLKAAIEGVLARQDNSSNFIFVKKKNQQVRLAAEDIVWIQAEGNYCFFHSKHGKYVVKNSIKKILVRLQYDSFITVYRGIVVNTDFIQAVDFTNNELVVGGEKLPIGKTYRKRLRKRLSIS